MVDSCCSPLTMSSCENLDDLFINSDADTVNRMAADCSNCSYEFIFQSLREIVTLGDIRDNFIPPEDRLGSIPMYLAEAEAELQRCSKESRLLRGFLEKLESRQTELKKSLSIHQSSISPIRRLPTELIVHIFSLCNADFWDLRVFESKLADSMGGLVSKEPFVIATVCSYWRDIALSTPELWSQLMLIASDNMQWSKEDYQQNNSDIGEPESRAFPEDMLTLALERAAEQPLHLWIDCSILPYWPSIFSTKLQAICSRIVQLHLTGNADPFAAAANLNFCDLRALDVYVHPQLEGKIPPFRWLASAKRLETLLLRNLSKTSPSVDKFWTKLPRKTIRVLVLDEIDFNGALSIISRFPKLESPSLRLAHSRDIGNFSTEKLVSSLQHLDLTIAKPHHYLCSPPYRCTCAYRSLWNLIASVTLPALTSLQISCSSTAISTWSQPTFSDFVIRSDITQKLTVLALHNVRGLDDEDLADVFRVMPALIRLTISECDGEPIVTTPVLSQLARSPSLLPQLAFLDIHIPDTVNAVTALARVIASRDHIDGMKEDFPVHLQEVVLRVKSKDDSETIVQLEKTLAAFHRTRYTIARLNYDDNCRPHTFNDWIPVVENI